MIPSKKFPSRHSRLSGVYFLLAIFLVSLLQAPVQALPLSDLNGPQAATDEQGRLLWREAYHPYSSRLLFQSPIKTITALASSSAPSRTRCTVFLTSSLPPGSPFPCELESIQDYGTNDRWFTGKPYEEDTGLSYFGARSYDPLLGRFMGVDPQGFDEKNLHSFNRYAYGNNNPYKYVDPDGQIVETFIDIASLGLGIAAFKTDPSFLNGLGVAYDAIATIVPGLPAGFGIVKNIGKTTDALGDAGRAGEIGKNAKPGSAGFDRTGKDFTPKTKAEIDAENAAQHGGLNKCEHCGVAVVPGQRSQRGVTPPSNERQRDHIVPKAQGGDGTLRNGQILCRECNLRKLDN